MGCFGQNGDKDAAVQRGKYLVDEVARCQTCHTPRMMGGGQLIRSQWLKGSTLDFVPVNETANWHAKTPDITSTSPLWTRWGEEGLVKFLETGRNPRGNSADPPMPAYNLTHEDAVAVVAYLKSLK
jgi:mono/diheme cytochrome c family protein